LWLAHVRSIEIAGGYMRIWFGRGADWVEAFVGAVIETHIVIIREGG
jgi:hypothetical protein